MIGYATFGTNDIDRAAAFYDPLMALLDGKRLWAYERGIAWGVSHDQPSLGLLKPFDEQPATVGNGTMVALRAPSTDIVDQVHLLALTLGGQNEGDVGPRGEGFYGGYFRDPDGNKLCVYCPI
jgi:catechol 2,3-dioxygenase-like lactoylglutathione lyase family enzyme